jgi:hypothetical protein
MPFIVKKTFDVASEAKAQVVVQLKDNQPTLRQRVESLCASGTPAQTVTTVDQARSRHETRTVAVFEAGSVATETEWQPHIAAVVCVTRDVLTRNAKTGLWTSTSETAFYLSNAMVCIPTKSATNSNRKPAIVPTRCRPSFRSEAGHHTDLMSAGSGC